MNTHPVFRDAIIPIEVLVSKNTIVVSLAASAATAAASDTRKDNEVVGARFRVAKEVLAATECHDIAGVIEVLATIIMVNRPHPIVTIYDEISFNDRWFCND